MNVKKSFGLIIAISFVAFFAIVSGSDGMAQSEPVQTEPLINIQRVFAGYSSTCAVSLAGDVSCWGYNSSGQLGRGYNVEYPSVAGRVYGVSDVLKLAKGSEYFCSLSQIGAVHCWGSILNASSHQEWGQPFPVLSSSALDVSGTLQHACVFVLDGRVACLGNNEAGQLGIGTNEPIYPFELKYANGLTQTTQIATGQGHSCALATAGKVFCWGSNFLGQLGNGTLDDKHTPTKVSSEEVFTTISLSAASSCAISINKDLFCWGLEPGPSGDTQSVPQKIALEDVIVVSTGNSFSCAITTDNSLYCWGYNTFGQLGNGTEYDSMSPVKVTTGKFKSVQIKFEHVCGVTIQDTVMCWGRNNDGQLGNGSYGLSRIPVEVVGLGEVRDLSLSPDHTCATTKEDNTVKCWGANSAGQLGDGTTEASTTPVQVVQLIEKVTTPTAIPTVTPIATATTVIYRSKFNVRKNGYEHVNHDETVVGTWRAFTDAYNFGGEITNLDLKQFEYFEGSFTGGLCMGYAATSALIFNEQLGIPDYVSEQKDVFELEYNQDLIDFLVTFQARQRTHEFLLVKQRRKDAGIEANIEALKAAVSSERLNILVVYGADDDKGQCEGHAVVPIAWSENAESVTIVAYDPNWPGEESILLSYNKHDKNWAFEISPERKWSSQNICEFAGYHLKSWVLAIPAELMNIAQTPYWRVNESIEDYLDDEVGYISASVEAVITATNVEPEVPLYGESQEGVAQFYMINAAAPITVENSSNTVIATTSSSLYVSSTTAITSSLNGSLLTLSSNNFGENTLGRGEGGDYLQLLGLGQYPGDRVRINFTEDSLNLTSGVTQTYELSYQPVNLSLEQYTLTMPTLNPGETHVLSPSKDTVEVSVGIDRDSNGTTDETVIVKPVDVGMSIYLPMIMQTQHQR